MNEQPNPIQIQKHLSGVDSRPSRTGSGSSRFSDRAPFAGPVCHVEERSSARALCSSTLK